MYNDFPILSSNDYQAIQEQYENVLFSDRKTCLSKICLLLAECKSSCQFILKQVNNLIEPAIVHASKEISTILENLQYDSSNSQAKNLDLFAFLTKISHTIEEFLLWQEHENKEYYKTLIFSNLTSLSKIQTKILSAISKSNVKIFKYM